MADVLFRTNRFPAFVISVLGLALIFTIDFDKLVNFYDDISLVLVVGFFLVALPATLFVGFSLRIRGHDVIYRHNLLFTKSFGVREVSHLLYQPNLDYRRR